MKTKLQILTCLFLLIALLPACKKNEKGGLYFRDINVTVYHANGDSTTLLSQAPPVANLGYGIFGGPVYVEINDPARAGVYFSVSDTSLMGGGVRSAGTYFTNNIYTFRAQYRPMGEQSYSYSNVTAAQPGSVTFSVLNAHYMEGFFSAVCKNGNDSVRVKGKFKGDF